MQAMRFDHWMALCALAGVAVISAGAHVPADANARSAAVPAAKPAAKTAAGAGDSRLARASFQTKGI